MKNKIAIFLFVISLVLLLASMFVTFIIPWMFVPNYYAVKIFANIYSVTLVTTPILFVLVIIVIIVKKRFNNKVG